MRVNLVIRFAAAVLLLLPCAQAENLTMGWSAALTSWNTEFGPLQSPGWTLPVHPGGIIDLQYKDIYCEVGGDPHRPREATTALCGLRHRLFHYKRVAIEGQVAGGGLLAPSFLEYCGSYEYKGGDCGAGNQVPEYCFWWAVDVGVGVKVRVTKTFYLVPGRMEYIAPYALSPRYRFSAGFVFVLH